MTSTDHHRIKRYHEPGNQAAPSCSSRTSQPRSMGGNANGSTASDAPFKSLALSAGSRGDSPDSGTPSATIAAPSRTHKMGLFGAISYIVGNIVGSGLFITPSGIYKQVGSVGFSLVIWAVGGLIAMLGSFCYVELGTSIRRSGADFAYICYVKWYPIAFAFMCCGCLIQYPATLAIQAETFAEYVFEGAGMRLCDPSATYYTKKLTGFALIWLLLFLNFFSLKTFVARFNIIASIAKIAATLMVVVIGFYFLIFKGWTQNLADPFNWEKSTITAGSTVTALFAGLYSYDGWDILNFGAEEIERPKRTMPLAIVIGMTMIAAIYVAVNVAYFVVLDAESFATSPAVAQTFATKTLGGAQVIIPIFVALLLIGSLNSTMFSASRYLQAAGRRGHMPRFLAGIHPASDSPRAALFVHVLLGMAFSFAGDLDTLISYASFVMWSQRAITMTALLYIRLWHLPVHPDGMHMPLVMLVLFGVICAGLIIVNIITDFETAVVSLAMLAGGLLFFCVFLFRRALPSFAVYRRVTGYLNDTTTRFMQIIFNIVPDEQPDDDDEYVSPRLTTNDKVHPVVVLKNPSFVDQRSLSASTCDSPPSLRHRATVERY